VATWEEAVEAGFVEVDGPDQVATPAGDRSVSTLHSPISPALRHRPGVKCYPSLAELGEASPWA
jgi:hypothetical protein